MKFQFADDQPIDPKLRYRCRHIFTDGHRCGSPALRGGSLCYYHRTAVELPNVNNGARTPDEFHFVMPPIEDRSGIQLGISQVLARLACNAIDHKRASLMLYGLQIASSNLPRQPHTAQLHQPQTASEPLVEDYTHCPNLGPLAEVQPLPTPEQPTQTSNLCHPDPEPVEGAEAAKPKDPETLHPTQTPNPFQPKNQDPTNLCHPERSGEAAEPKDPETLHPTQTPNPFQPQNPDSTNPCHPERSGEAAKPKDPDTSHPAQTPSPFPPQNPSPSRHSGPQVQNLRIPYTPTAEDPTLDPAFWDPALWERHAIDYKEHDPHPPMAS